MKLRSALMTALKQHLTRDKMSQAKAAKLFDVAQPRVSDLMRGKINVFGLDALVNMAAVAGLHIEMRVNESTCRLRHIATLGLARLRNDIGLSKLFDDIFRTMNRRQEVAGSNLLHEARRHLRVIK